MQIIDERFFTVHPRTTLWWAERETCRRCAHLRLPVNQSWTCAVARNGPNDATCIRARERPLSCGPEARLFKPK